MNVLVNICQYILSKLLKEENRNLTTAETVIDKDSEKSDTERGTTKLIEDSKYPQNYEDGDETSLDDQNEKERNDPRMQAMFKRSIHDR